MTTSSYLLAIEQNNKGVQHLADGHQSDEGLAALARSIRLFKEELARVNQLGEQQQQQQQQYDSDDAMVTEQDLQDDESTTTTMTMQSCHDGFPRKSRSSCVSHDVATILTEMNGMNDSGQDEYIFNHAMTIPAGKCSPFEDPTEFELQVCSAAVIFNLALEHHRRAQLPPLSESCAHFHIGTNHDKTKTGASPSQRRFHDGHQEEQQVCFTKAEKLYSMVLQLLRDHDTMSASSTDAPQGFVLLSMLVQVAAHNNLAQLYYSQNRYESAHAILADLISLVTDHQQHQQLQHMNQSYEEEDLFQQPQLQGVLLNALFLKSPRVAAAA